MSKKPTASPVAASAVASSSVASDVSIIKGKTIIPVESSSYRTVDFSKEDRDVILYSGGLSQCLLVLIKNQSAEGKYDNVVTMMHFYPNNASEEDLAKKNFDKGFKEFSAKCGGDLRNVSISLLGGFVEADQRPEDSIRGALIDGIKQSRFFSGCKFSAHEASITSDPRKFQNIVFVNKDGTAIVRNVVQDKKIEVSFISKKIDSIGDLDSLVAIHNEYTAITTGFPGFTLQRSREIGQRAKNGEDLMTMDSAADIIAQYKLKLSKDSAAESRA